MIIIGEKGEINNEVLMYSEQGREEHQNKTQRGRVPVQKQGGGREGILSEEV